MSDTGATQTQQALALSAAGGGGRGRAGGSQTDLVSWGGGGDGAMAGPDEGAMQMRPYNQRIELPSVDDCDGDTGRARSGGSVDDDGIHDLDEDELTRDKVKKAASHVSGYSTADTFSSP